MFQRWHLAGLLESLSGKETPLWKSLLGLFVFVAKCALIIGGAIVLIPLTISVFGILCQKFMIDPTDATAKAYRFLALTLLLSSLGGAAMCAFIARLFPRERSDEEILKDDLKHLKKRL